MQTPKFIISMLVGLFLVSTLLGQSNFSLDSYRQFLIENQNLPARTLLERHAPASTYYKDLASGTLVNDFAYLDSIKIKYNLTDDELALLQKNRFVVTERLNFATMGFAFHDIYIKDLPVFVTTDAILDVLHASYDKLLMQLECEVLEPNLLEILEGMRQAFPSLVSKYQKDQQLQVSLADVDLYLTLAYSLLKEKKLNSQFSDQKPIDTLWEAVKKEDRVELPLFSERLRTLDFSQFTVRGHYTQEFWDGTRNRTLGAYFQAMMWLGRMDFFLTAPPRNPWEAPWGREEIRRMNLGAFLLNELIDLAQVRPLLNKNDQMIEFMVGESDNLTPTEYTQMLKSQSIQRADELLNDSVYDKLYSELILSEYAGQKILSDILMMDPQSAEPDTLPVSFRLMGQRFIIDSYIFYSLVYPNIIYQNEKIWRPMPDPLDALFVLGNDNALPLLKNELEKYNYSSQAASLRYLVDAYDPAFWQISLYNVWLDAIRSLNPPKSNSQLPLFMQTTAWQQQKINTQLASWTQLRHDNLLYAKQSYTGATGCSYPHSYVEPYPEFYLKIADFADRAGIYFTQIPISGDLTKQIKDYFPRLKKVMLQLAEIARKEVARQPLTSVEISFLKAMLFIDGGSGAPPFSGWYTDLYFDPWDEIEQDYLIADVHTQPDDEFGNPVGKVLHVGVGKVNLGIFLVQSPSENYQPVAFVGPLMSYYEKVTRDLDRLTDERWTKMIDENDLPVRPDWVNIYLTNPKGDALQPGRELFGAQYTGIPAGTTSAVPEFLIAQNYPNPFNPVTTIAYSISTESPVRISVYDVLGKQVAMLLDGKQTPGKHQIQWQASGFSSGLYFCQIQAGASRKVLKLVLMK